MEKLCLGGGGLWRSCVWVVEEVVGWTGSEKLELAHGVYVCIRVCGCVCARTCVVVFVCCGVNGRRLWG